MSSPLGRRLLLRLKGRHFMKKTKVLLLLVLAAILLCGCRTSVYYSDDLPVYPGTKWNMTPMEAIKALGLSEGDFKVEADDSAETSTEEGTVPTYAFSVPKAELFGAEAKVTFLFLSYTEGYYGLASVVAVYPEDADMEAVYDRMKKELGTPAMDASEESGMAYWDSKAQLMDYLPEGTVSEELLTLYSGQPAVRVFWNEKASLLYASSAAEGSNHLVVFDGYLVRHLQSQG